MPGAAAAAASSSQRAVLDRSNTSRNSKGFNSSLNLSRRSKNATTNDFDDSLISLEVSEGGNGRASLNDSERSNPQNPQSGNSRARRPAGPKKSRRNTDRSKQQSSDSFRSNESAGGNTPSPSWMPCWLKPIDQARRSMGRFINCDRFQYFILTLIMINAVMMGVATFPFVKENPEISDDFELLDQIFLVIFTVESGLQLIYHGLYLFKDGFLVFDMLIVILSWALEGTQVIRAFRIFRALRLVTRVATTRNLVSAMFDVMPKLGAIFSLMCLVFYIFGVMFTQLYKDMSKEGLDPMGYFSSLPNTLFTLFQIMCLVSHVSLRNRFPQIVSNYVLKSN
jgi:hypothetical protein